MNDGRVGNSNHCNRVKWFTGTGFPNVDKLTKFPLVEIGQDVRKTLKNMNTAIESTDKLVKQLDGKASPGLQATLDDVRKTVRSSESILSSDAPLQQDVRKALQQ